MISKSVLRTLLVLAEGLSGAIGYYACEGLSDYFVFREGVDQRVARLFFLVLFPLLSSSSLVLLTIAWHRILSYKNGLRYPEFSIIVGVILLLPVYFELASHLLYNPAPIHVSELGHNLLWLYALLPLTIMEFVTYTFSLHVYAIAAVSALVTGYLMRRRARDIGAPSAQQETPES